MTEGVANMQPQFRNDGICNLRLSDASCTSKELRLCIGVSGGSPPAAPYYLCAPIMDPKVLLELNRPPQEKVVAEKEKS